MLLTPIIGMPLPIPISLSEGLMAQSKEELNRLFHHFRAQGYEGIIAKDLNGTYHLAGRDPSWVKRKPEITLDLVLMGGVFAVTSKENAGLFGSYVVGMRTAAGGFEIVGDVAGLDKVRDQNLQSEVMRAGPLDGPTHRTPQRQRRPPRPGVPPASDRNGEVRGHRPRRENGPAQPARPENRPHAHRQNRLRSRRHLDAREAALGAAVKLIESASRAP